MPESNMNWLELESAAGQGSQIAIVLETADVQVTLFGSQAKSAAVVREESPSEEGSAGCKAGREQNWADGEGSAGCEESLAGHEQSRADGESNSADWEERLAASEKNWADDEQDSAGWEEGSSGREQCRADDEQGLAADQEMQVSLSGLKLA